MEGVDDVISGYSGGTKETAKYNIVSTGSTGHAEAILITYDPAKTSYGQLLKVFFSVAHDPTTLNRQGSDVCPQYRSAIFYVNEQQKRVAEGYNHQDYAAQNRSNPYIVNVSDPKVEKLKKMYPACVRKKK